MGVLTTHVLDTARGRPGAGIGVRLFKAGDERTLVCAATTNGDGRTDRPLLDADDFTPGTYELEFAVAGYFADSGLAAGQPPFLDVVTVRFTLGEDRHYHIPLLVSPWSYSTYRGS